jgi:hypothetical protein
MYDTIRSSLIGGSSGALDTLGTEVGSTFTAVVPVVVPILGAIALAFFGIKVFRAMLHV